MVFSSVTFIFFFLPIVLIIDKLLASRKTSRNLLLIFSSLFFYLWGEGTGVLLLLVIALINFSIGYKLYSCSNITWKNVLLTLGILLNLILLFYFKYFSWLMSELGSLFPSLFGSVKIEVALPLGISFFVFHAISYLVDTYKGIVKKHGPLDFFTYFFMFPHLIAGPIVRFSSVQFDIQNRVKNYDLFVYGAFRFILGVNKKILIANSVAPIADICFSTNNLSATDAWLGVLAYTIQIYFDFSGYSDMAIGLAAMFGIQFKENFSAPYRCTSIKDFWRKWHISLSTWFRDYLYIPLGGSRCSKLLTYRNLLAVFILCGLWHGAEWTFVIWGLFHGCLLIFERLGLQKLLVKLPYVCQRIYSIFFIIIGWVFFRSDNMKQALSYLDNMFCLNITPVLSFGIFNLVALILGLLICSTQWSKFLKIEHCNSKNPIALVNIPLFCLSLLVLYSNSRNPFIYFNF